MANPFPFKAGVSYFGNYFLKHFQEDLKEIVRGGCNTLVLTFSEQDLQYYRGTMKDFVKASHDAGLEVYLDPWAVGKVFGGESYSEFLVRHSEVRQISSEGEPLPIACLHHPTFQEFLKAWCDVGFELGTDYFFWDEPHFHIFEGELAKRVWSCRCSYCQQHFETQFKKPMPEKLTEEVALFRQDAIVRFIQMFCDYTKKEGFKNAVCLLPEIFSEHALQDWSYVAKIESLDIIGTDPYWHLGNSDVKTFVQEYAKRVYQLAVAYHKEPQLWILNFRIKKGEEKHIETALEVAYQEGIRNFAAWSYLGTSPMSFLKSDDPAKVWETLTNTYQRLKNHNP